MMTITLPVVRYDSNFDYSLLPCAPELSETVGPWSHVWDFTTGQHGWVIDEYGEFVTGEGWKPTPHEYGHYSTYIMLHFDRDATLTEIEMTSLNVAYNNPSSIVQTHLGMKFYGQWQVAFYQDKSEGDQVVTTWTGELTTPRLRVANVYVSDSAATRLVRLRVAGVGGPPGLP